MESLELRNSCRTRRRMITKMLSCNRSWYHRILFLTRYVCSCPTAHLKGCHVQRKEPGSTPQLHFQIPDLLMRSQLNVVLDYNKFENASLQVQNPRVREDASKAFPAPAQPFFVQADVDLALLVEDATETVVAGHFFDNLPGSPGYDDDDNVSQKSYRAGQGIDRGTTQDVKVILQLSARPSWSVRTSPGAVSRIVMNLVGNTLKFTSTGNICIDLEP